jgi:hypothetical protein
VLRTLLAQLIPTSQASGVIYGTLVTAGTMVAAAEGTGDAGDVTLTVIVTLLLYWIAHSYAEAIGNSDVVAPSWQAAGRQLTEESRMVGACVIPLAVMLVTDWIGLSFEAAVSVALLVTILLLFAWGVTAARRAHLSGGWAIASGFLYTLLGLVIVVLKRLLVH